MGVGGCLPEEEGAIQRQNPKAQAEATRTSQGNTRTQPPDCMTACSAGTEDHQRSA